MKSRSDFTEKSPKHLVQEDIFSRYLNKESSLQEASSQAKLKVMEIICLCAQRIHREKKYICKDSLMVEASEDRIIFWSSRRVQEKQSSTIYQYDNSAFYRKPSLQNVNA